LSLKGLFNKTLPAKALSTAPWVKSLLKKKKKKKTTLKLISSFFKKGYPLEKGNCV
jgi:hypothetical protein